MSESVYYFGDIKIWFYIKVRLYFQRTFVDQTILFFSKVKILQKKTLEVIFPTVRKQEKFVGRIITSNFKVYIHKIQMHVYYPMDVHVKVSMTN